MSSLSASVHNPGRDNRYGGSHLTAACAGDAARMAWLDRLPHTISQLERRWSLTIGPPWTSDATCSWTAPAVRLDGARVVLKLGMPHMEAEDEIKGLRFWAGDPTVDLLEADETCNALLIERCEPGGSLRDAPEPEQDVVLAGLLQRLWRRRPPPGLFRPLSTMIACWIDETEAAHAAWPDATLVRAGLRAFEALAVGSRDQALLATDLHAGNVLRAQREPWLVIDPKPFVGDRAYDATQHLLNCAQRMSTAPHDTIRRVATLFDVDAERIRMWMFARSAAEPRQSWTDEAVALARALA